VSGFSAEWLKLREPYDLRARNNTVLKAVLDLLSQQPSVAIVDLACGTGSTFRALSPHIQAAQHWRLVDNDLSLLARGPSSSPPHIHVTRAPVDLSRDLEAAFDRPADLMTTSALLDLVSNDWLNRLVVEAATRQLPVYAALSYDGRIEFAPSDPLDSRIADAMNRHQRTDKGFGPALGPTAAQAAIAAFERVGYQVTHGVSDWEFGALDREIQTEALSGWAGAAREMRVIGPNDIIDWLKRRRELIAAGRSSIRVGHVDLLARPIATR
jgi:hypothetical protein